MTTDEDYTLQGRLRNWSGKRYETHEYDWGGSQDDEMWQVPTTQVSPAAPDHMKLSGASTMKPFTAS